MQKLRKGDTVQATKGKDKGKRGKILALLPGGKKALVEGVNMLKKHKRRTQQDQQGGVVSIEAPLSIANLMLVCKQCNRPVRVGFTTSGDNNKQRFCKTCKEAL